MKGKGKTVGLIYDVIIIVALTVIALKVLFAVCKVSGQSMAPTYSDKELVAVNRFATPKNGDVVLIYPHEKWAGPIYIKRVVGIPGDTLFIVNNKLYVNDVEVEAYDGIENAGVLSEPLTLGSDEYFVIGDNYNHSIDSRVIGSIKKDHVIGKLLFQRKF